MEKVPFKVNIADNLHMIWMYCTKQLLTIPLSQPWLIKKTGGGILKCNNVTHEEKPLEGEDYVKATINFMSNPVASKEDFPDGLSLVIGKQWDDTTIS